MRFGRHTDRITGRRWLSLGWLHLGFGPDRWLERIWWGSRVIWYNRTALEIHRLKALLHECEKDLRRRL